MAEPGDSPLLSVLMPTLVKREALFLGLVDWLLTQAEASDAPVEVVGLQNAGEQPLAAYREALLRDARGEYLCFIDDDDAVPDYYVAEIVSALREHPDADAVTWVQDGTGTNAGYTLFSVAFRHAPRYPVLVAGVLVDGEALGTVAAYLRAYSHMQPLRAEIARQGSFIAPDGPGHTGEDYQFAQSVVPLLVQRGSREVHIDRIMYSYHWMRAGESTQHGRQDGRDGEHDRPVIASPCFRWCGG